MRATIGYWVWLNHWVRVLTMSLLRIVFRDDILFRMVVVHVNGRIAMVRTEVKVTRGIGVGDRWWVTSIKTDGS